MITINITEIDSWDKVQPTITLNISEGERQAIMSILNIQKIDLNEKLIEQSVKQYEEEQKYIIK